jgi:hypothetical protein
LRIQLKQTYLPTGDETTVILETPIAVGRSPEHLPSDLAGQPVAQLVLSDDQVAGYHALIQERNREVTITDQTSATGMRVNSAPTPSSPLSSGDFIQIGRYQIQVDLNVPDTDFPETGGECDQMVGFLVRKRCGRRLRVGCPNCDAGHPNNDPYYTDHAYYTGYGSYRSGYWGSNHYYYRDSYSYDPETGNVDFTEADGASLGQELDADFEQDMGAS